MGHDEGERAGAQSFDERGMLGIEIAGLLDDGGVVVLRLFGEPLNGLGRDLLRLLGGDLRSAAEQAAQDAGAGRGAGGAEEVI